MPSKSPVYSVELQSAATSEQRRRDKMGEVVFAALRAMGNVFQITETGVVGIVRRDDLSPVWLGMLKKYEGEVSFAAARAKSLEKLAAQAPPRTMLGICSALLALDPANGMAAAYLAAGESTAAGLLRLFRAVGCTVTRTGEKVRISHTDTQFLQEFLDETMQLKISENRPEMLVAIDLEEAAKHFNVLRGVAPEVVALARAAGLSDPVVALLNAAHDFGVRFSPDDPGVIQGDAAAVDAFTDEYKLQIDLLRNELRIAAAHIVPYVDASLQESDPAELSKRVAWVSGVGLVKRSF